MIYIYINTIVAIVIFSLKKELPASETRDETQCESSLKT